VNGRTRTLAFAGLGLLIALALPQILYPVLALRIFLYGLFAVSVDLLLGFAGLLSFGHAAYWGVAGYTAAILAQQLRLEFPLAVIAGTATAMIVALPLGYLAIRRRGIYFAMVTLAFAQMIFYVANSWRDVTGGENGVQGVPRVLFGSTIGRSIDFYYAALPFILFGFVFAYRVVRSPFGHVLVAIRDNEPRAQALGYPTSRYKLTAFVLSAGIAGLAGSLFAIGSGFATLDMLHWTTSGTVVLMAVLGGIGTLWGSVIGAAVVLILQDQLASITDASGVVTGAVLIAIVLGFRRGIWRTLARPLALPMPVRARIPFMRRQA
jgi:branched-chain amino acid transport system permease protein